MKLNWKEDWPLYLIIAGIVSVIVNEAIDASRQPPLDLPQRGNISSVAGEPPLFDQAQVQYGQDIIAHTAAYFGPKGKVKQITNGMNCQNCHLEAGTKSWGNNYSAVYANYPKFRSRSGSIETVPKRINDCFERSLNGQALDTTSKEMQALLTYMQWVGRGVAKGQIPAGTGIHNLPYLDRAANPSGGKQVYAAKCQVCHGAEGRGIPDADSIGYIYPPLWGPHSYNEGAGLFRLSRFAGYVKDNMPFNQSTHAAPALTNEEAWDVAAFVNSQARPKKDLSGDWPDITAKPVDHPFGPYADGFSERQHKYGPFQPIADARRKQKTTREITVSHK